MEPTHEQANARRVYVEVRNYFLAWAYKSMRETDQAHRPCETRAHEATAQRGITLSLDPAAATNNSDSIKNIGNIGRSNEIPQVKRPPNGRFGRCGFPSPTQMATGTGNGHSGARKEHSRVSKLNNTISHLQQRPKVVGIQVLKPREVRQRL